MTLPLSGDDIQAVAAATSLSVDQVTRIATSVNSFATKLQGSLFLPRVRTYAQLRCSTAIGPVRRAFWCLTARALGVAGR